MVGVDVVFYASCDDCSETEWTFIPTRFVLGDAGLLARFIQRFFYLHEAFQTITSNQLGAGRTLRDAPRKGREGRIHFPIEKPLRKSFSTLAMKDGDLDLERGVVSGADATHSQMEYALNSSLGWPMAPHTGSQLSRLYHHPAFSSDQGLFSEMIKAEMLRLSVGSVKSILWIGDVHAWKQAGPEKAVLATAVVDGVGGPTINSNLKAIVSDEPPEAFDIYNLKPDVLGFSHNIPRIDRLLTAILTCASGKTVSVSLGDIRKEIGPDANRWDLRGLVGHLLARGDLISAEFDGEGEDVTLKCVLTSSHGGVTSGTLEVVP